MGVCTITLPLPSVFTQHYHFASLGKLYVYELRAMKSPKHVIEAHQGAITCIAEQNSVKVARVSLRKG